MVGLIVSQRAYETNSGVIRTGASDDSDFQQSRTSVRGYKHQSASVPTVYPERSIQQYRGQGQTLTREKTLVTELIFHRLTESL